MLYYFPLLGGVISVLFLQGACMATGTFDELARSGVDFASLLKRDDDDDKNRQMEFSQITIDPKSANYIPFGESDLSASDALVMSRSLDPQSMLRDTGTDVDIKLHKSVVQMNGGVSDSFTHHSLSNLPQNISPKNTRAAAFAKKNKHHK